MMMRKSPQQQRSKELVNILMLATEKCICQHGLEGVTTPKIAELSGISVGSIYQYFKNKQMMIDCLLEQKSHEIGTQLKQILQDHIDDDLESIIKAAIEFGFYMLKHNSFYVEIMKHWHQISSTNATDIMQQYFYDLGQQILIRHSQSIATDQLNVRLFIIINSTMYSMMRYISVQPSFISQDEMTKSLSEMLIKYLKA
jgi:AcrR family transcriptional regulator